MEERIKKIMAEILNVDQQSINEDSSVDTIETWNSLRHMNLILGLEEEFEVQFNEEQILEIMSFKLIQLTLKELIEK